MKREAVIGGVVSLFFMILLLVYTPDVISLAFLLGMCVIMALGFFFGIMRISRFSEALRYGRHSIRQARSVQTESPWLVLQSEECVFGDDDLDDEFHNYCLRMKQLGDKGYLILPVEEYINDDLIAMRSWQNLLSQIPGTLTSLGVLGTFLGLVLGINGLGFSSLYLAVESIDSLLTGIELAFYTSISGVILSVVFNLTYHLVLERNAQELNLFLQDFHRHVLPEREDALLQRQLEFMDTMTKGMELLQRQSGEAQ